jgi:hypothetical protein
MQVTQAMSLLEAQPKNNFNIGCDHYAPSMAIILSVHALHFQRAMSIGKHGDNSNKTSPSKIVNKNRTF